MRQTRRLPFDPIEWRARAVHSGERSGDERQSTARLAAVFAEEDAEISARLGEDITVEYRFTCRFCKSKFSLAQQIDRHEAECGRVEQPQEVHQMPGNGQRPIVCRHCGHESPGLAAHMKHLLDAHREEVLARRREAAAARTAARTAADAVSPSAVPPRAHTVHAAGAAEASPVHGASSLAHAGGHGQSAAHTCPLCGGHLPKSTADMLAELTRVGLAETQAFEAVKIARRVFAAPAAAA